MIDVSGVPTKRTESVLKKGTEKSSVNSAISLADGIFPVLALNEKQERDEQENKKDNQLGQFLRGVKDPSEKEVSIEDI